MFHKSEFVWFSNIKRYLSSLKPYKSFCGSEFVWYSNIQELGDPKPYKCFEIENL